MIEIDPADIDEMKSDPEIASELRDKRTNYELREEIEKLDQSRILLVKLWAFRNRAEVSVKGECIFCMRNVAVGDAAKDLNLTLLCLLCWLRAGRPGDVEPIPSDKA